MSAKANDDTLAQWAEDPSTWGDLAEVLTGDAAANFGRALLESAGIDVAAVERNVGRLRIGGTSATKGTRSPRVNVAISDHTAELLEQLGERVACLVPTWFAKPSTFIYNKPSDKQSGWNG